MASPLFGASGADLLQLGTGGCSRLVAKGIPDAMVPGWAVRSRRRCGDKSAGDQPGKDPEAILGLVARRLGRH